MTPLSVSRSKVARQLVPALVALGNVRKALCDLDLESAAAALELLEESILAIEDECGSVTPQSLFRD